MRHSQMPRLLCWLEEAGSFKSSLVFHVSSFREGLLLCLFGRGRKAISFYMGYNFTLCLCKTGMHRSSDNFNTGSFVTFGHGDTLRFLKAAAFFATSLASAACRWTSSIALRVLVALAYMIRSSSS
jgi:hypothetical protein